jgi:hypothetical protein
MASEFGEMVDCCRADMGEEETEETDEDKDEVRENWSEILKGEGELE